MMGTQEAGSDISTCTRYCYRLWRKWDESLPTLGFILLNPTMGAVTASAPEIDRCIMRAVDLDFGAIEVVYLFPLRTLDPSHLVCAPDAIGKQSKADGAILDVFDRASTVIAAWGDNSVAPPRATEVLELIQRLGYGNSLFRFGFTKDGSPKDMKQLRGRGRPVRWVI